MSHLGKAGLFILLSLVDLSLTWLLLNHHGSNVGEANPVAAWFLETHGWLGMAIFKGCMAFLVVGICALVALRRPVVAHRVLTLGIVVVGCVVAYSCFLTGQLGVESQQRLAQQDEEYPYGLDEITPEEFFQIHQDVAQEMVEGNYNLRGAVREVGYRLEGRIWCSEVYEGKVPSTLSVTEDGPVEIDMIPVEDTANRLIQEASVLLRDHSEDGSTIARRLVLDSRGYFEIEPPSSLLEIAYPEQKQASPAIRTRTLLELEPEFADAL